jgi:aspartate racemase
MKKLGLIGGISWVSTIDYYRLINEGVNAKLGGMNFAEVLIHSFNYADIKRNNDAGDWERTFEMLSGACEGMKNSGVSGIILCANTMHLLAERIEERIGLPVIHVATETATTISLKNIRKVGLLGTKFTMELDFFKDKLAEKNITALIPDEADRAFIHKTIFDELGSGKIVPATKARYLEIIQELIAAGAEGIILGCTEIPLLIQQEDVAVPVFDTTRIHADAAVRFMAG